jgi:hypothetical protein
MSLSRTALRLTAMEALRPSAIVLAGTAGPWPTLAAQYVFDSRLDPIGDLKDDERRPVVVIYTDDDSGDAGQKAGGPPFKRDVDLMFEISVAAMVTDDGATYAPGTPLTDGELEASLDLLEAQIRFSLMYAPCGVLWRNLTGRRVTSIHSAPKRTSEESARLAMRTLRLKTTIPDDDYVAAPATALTGNDRLPEPLKSVIAALASGSYGAALGAGLAPPAPQMPVATPLQTVTFDMQPSAPPAPLDDTKPQINFEADNLQG